MTSRYLCLIFFLCVLLLVTHVSAQCVCGPWDTCVNNKCQCKYDIGVGEQLPCSEMQIRHSAYSTDGLPIFNRKNRLVLSLPIPRTMVPRFTYRWTVYEDGNDISNYKGIESTLTGIYLVLGAEASQPGSTYTFSVTIQKVGDNIPPLEITLMLRASAPPVNDYEDDPYSAFDVLYEIESNTYLFNATGWSEPDLLFSYSLLSSIESTDINSRETITATYIPLNSFSSSSELNTTLPKTSSSLTIRLAVKNKYGDVTYAIRDDIGGSGRLMAPEFDSELSSNILQAVTQLYANIEMFGDRQEYYQAFQEQIEAILEYMKQRDAEEISDEYTMYLRLAMIEILTRHTDRFTDLALELVLDVVKNLFGQSDTLARRKLREEDQSLFTDDSLTVTASALSNLASITFNHPLFAQETYKLTQELGKQALLTKIPTSYPTELRTQNFVVSVQLDSLSSLKGSIVTVDSTTNTSVSIPNQFLDNFAAEEFIGYVYTIFSAKNNPYSWSNETEDAMSGIIDFKVKAENGSTIKLENIPEELILHFDRLSIEKYDSSNDTRRKEIVCRYWDENEKKWMRDGCRLVSADDNLITCACDHTTSFSSFMLYVDESERESKEISIIGIVFNAVYIIIIVTLLVLLILLRNEQPLKSRFIAPFIGLSALLVDAVLQGIIKNSLMLSGQSLKAINSFTYLIMVTANPLIILAVFVFLWQHIRFILMQNLYAIMELKKLRTAHIQKLFTSKLAYAILSIVLCAVVFVYFLILVIVDACTLKGTSTTEAKNTLIIVQSVSYSAITIALGILLIAAVVVDLLLSYRRESTSSKNDKGEKKIMNEPIIIVDLFRKDDVLYFRVEALLLIVTILVSFVLYSLSIASLFSSNRNPLRTASFAIELLYLFVNIVAFGGFDCLITLRSAIIRRRNRVYEATSTNPDKDSSGLKEEIEGLLRSEHGYKLLHDYCKREFSLENLLLWKELERISSDPATNTSVESRKEAMDLLYKTYLLPSCLCEVNVSFSIKRKFTDAMKDDNLSEVGFSEALRTLHTAIFLNISDTYSRLIDSREYSQYRQTKLMEQELKNTLL